MNNKIIFNYEALSLMFDGNRNFNKSPLFEKRSKNIDAVFLSAKISAKLSASILEKPTFFSKKRYIGPDFLTSTINQVRPFQTLCKTNF